MNNVKVVCPKTHECAGKRKQNTTRHCSLHKYESPCKTKCSYNKGDNTLCVKPTKEIITYLVLQKIK